MKIYIKPLYLRWIELSHKLPKEKKLRNCNPGFPLPEEYSKESRKMIKEIKALKDKGFEVIESWTYESLEEYYESI